MAKHFFDCKTKCVYYLHEDSQVIYCNLVPGKVVIHLAFASKTEAKDYKLRRCRSNYKPCIIYQALEKREREKNDEQN